MAVRNRAVVPEFPASSDGESLILGFRLDHDPKLLQRFCHMMCVIAEQRGINRRLAIAKCGNEKSTIGVALGARDTDFAVDSTVERMYFQRFHGHLR
jgi:hypothetical protein